MRQVALDTETTGMSTEQGHRVIEIGCVEIINRKITGNHYHVYVNPERGIERNAQEVHGITDTFLADKPTFREVCEQLMRYLDGAELIIHNAPFDVGFLNYELGLANQGYNDITNYCAITDSLALARRKHPGQRNSLDALCRRYEVDNSSRDLHGALIDAELLAKVYLAMTGGQVALSLDTDDSQAPTQAEATTTTDQLADKSTPRAEPTTEEKQAHDNYLQWMMETYHSCVWYNQ